jgi:hypothetical protein|tara:strand:+ start:785 stop:1042 length:258 start_codon:yes stop_codon:yes gene_type:complete
MIICLLFFVLSSLQIGTVNAVVRDFSEEGPYCEGLVWGKADCHRYHDRDLHVRVVADPDKTDGEKMYEVKLRAPSTFAVPVPNEL